MDADRFLCVSDFSGWILYAFQCVSTYTGGVDRFLRSSGFIDVAAGCGTDRL